MNDKEKCIAILDTFNENQLENILTLLQAARNAIDVAINDAYCELLFQQYEDDPNKEEIIGLEKAENK